MSKQEVILCEGLANSLTHAIEKCPHDKLFILTDEHTHRLCRPHLNGIPTLEEAEEIIIGAEDVHKNLETLAAVWQALSEKGASRHSLLINLGGGMVTDLGGFAASTFKRGHRLHQRSHYATRHGRRFRGRQDGHQLQRSEE